MPRSLDADALFEGVAVAAPGATVRPPERRALPAVQLPLARRPRAPARPDDPVDAALRLRRVYEFDPPGRADGPSGRITAPCGCSRSEAPTASRRNDADAILDATDRADPRADGAQLAGARGDGQLHLHAHRRSRRRVPGRRRAAAGPGPGAAAVRPRGAGARLAAARDPGAGPLLRRRGPRARSTCIWARRAALRRDLESAQ